MREEDCGINTVAMCEICNWAAGGKCPHASNRQQLLREQERSKRNAEWLRAYDRPNRLLD